MGAHPRAYARAKQQHSTAWEQVMSTEATPVPPRERIFTLDVIRGPALDLLLAIAPFFAVQVPISKWWLARYELGPMEWVWRKLTYGQASLVQNVVRGQHQ
jgi:uncharacterized membrane protein YeiB